MSVVTPKLKGMIMTETCGARFVLDFDAADCQLHVGHVGFHECRGDGSGAILWVEKHTGSTGYTSPRETWPDDGEADAAIAEAHSLTEAIWEIAEKYDVPVTNNYPRWQEGRFLREIGEFIGDMKTVIARFAPDSNERGVDA